MMGYVYRGTEFARLPYEPMQGYSSVDLSADAMERFRQLPRLISAIDALQAIAQERSYHRISATTRSVAIDLVKKLPLDRILPKVSVDEDGDILMVWDGEQNACALVVEGPVLHFVRNPGSESTHFAAAPVFWTEG
jgi:hypothetical protein